MLKLIESYTEKVKEVCEVYGVDNFNQYTSKGELITCDNAYKWVAITLIKEGFTYKEIVGQVELRIRKHYNML